MIARPILTLCVCAVVGVCAGRTPAAEVARFEETFRPTGMAVLVVENGKVSLVHTSGVRSAGERAVVGRTTRFSIASMGKAFLAAGLAVLVEEGRLRWDDPVVRHLPEFRTSEPYVTAHVTVRDLLAHRSGLPLGAGDLLTWPDGQASVQEAVRAVAYLPMGAFRERFLYSNTMYRVAAAVLEAVSGRPWEEFVTARILNPLGMSGCRIDPRRAERESLARQHTRTGIDAPASPIADLVEYPDPAGGMVCTIEDLGRWALFQLGDGTGADGQRVLSAARLAEMHEGITPRRISGLVRRLAGSNLGLYGLGWEVSDFHGHALVEHSGQASGGLSHIAMLPKRKAAVVAVANDNATPVAVLSYQILAGIAAGDAASDWISDVRQRLAGAPKQAKPREPGRAAVSTSRMPVARLAEFVGTYRDPWYGDLVVSQKGGELRLHLTRSRLLEGPLEPLGGDRFIARWPNRDLDADAEVEFPRGADGAITGMKLKAASADADFSYDYHDLKPVRVR